MKPHLVILFACGWAVAGAEAQYGSSPPAPPPSLDTARTNAALAAEDVAQYVVLNQQECELSAQLRLLTELEQEHRKRADESAKGEQPGKAKWEADLAQELADKAAISKQQVEEVTKKRLAFEESHKLLGAALSELRARSSVGGQNADEVAYLAKLDEKLRALEQDLNALVEEGRLYAVQLSTNRVPEEVPNITAMIQEASRRLRQVQKEQSDLELQKLQFRALRRR